ncbi:site-specific integrase [Marinifilum breve]|uniref:Site-specific integrase n=1 Tax=Marinifilum breve TaxID=2184082 RepID=A0A2V3ZSV6_9BACT|nr:site-specific integrase [Marinifilum breve]PXX96925.1 site-specific integrase [Marinifilum breve]
METGLSDKNFPQNFPTKMSGKLTHKIIIKNDYVRADGTCALYVQIFLDGKMKRLPLNISIEPKNFDKKNQRVKGKSQHAKDLNLIISQKLADINKIAVSYRLNGTYLSLEKLLEELANPSIKADYLKFYEYHLEKQKEILKPGTYRQQKATLTKLKKFRENIFFYEITDEFLNELVAYCKNKLGNEKTTIQTTLKNFKKYLHIANKNGIRTPLIYEDIEVKSFKGQRTYLNSNEVKALYEYRNSSFTIDSHRCVLNRFLFSCFTGLRISDNLAITEENVIGDHLVFVASKPGKFQKILLTESAKKFININGPLFNDNFTEEHINRELKSIAKVCGIKKTLTFHVSRHTFATNFLLTGGRVEVLQKLLGHSNIRETMIYVHITDSIMDEQIVNLDTIIKEPQPD